MNAAQADTKIRLVHLATGDELGSCEVTWYPAWGDLPTDTVAEGHGPTDEWVWEAITADAAMRGDSPDADKYGWATPPTWSEAK